ncbi:MAG TPA: Wzz/FepE/Etk N-terminal domain-containing protein [Bryobacteraceae bacterium]|nr:Wzz/FepE/Etk N-terminal domain-containing protein [Bryobacteraceae bacterium]
MTQPTLLEEESAPAARRPLDLDDYAGILRRNRTWILAPFFAALVASVVIAFLWPDTYISTATIRVAPPQVPESFVPANTSQDIQGRVDALVQLILNRATLTSIINAHGLYKNKLARMPMDDVIEDMKRNDVQVVPVRQALNAGQRETQQYPAFEIRFAYSERFTAQKVTADLVARFLEENVREVSQQAVSTTQFLQDQWEESRKKLDELEQRLSVFRAQNMGRLPEEQQNNYQQLTAMQAEKLNLNMSMNRVNQERLLYENQLRIYRGQLAALRDPNAPEQAELNGGKLADKNHEIAEYEDSLATARERYKENHPDVQRLLNLLASARKQRDAMAAQSAKSGAAAQRVPSPQFLREQRDLEAESQRTQGLIQAKDVEMDDYRKQSDQVDGAIRNYEARIQGTPVGIREYDELIRDRDLAKKGYEDLDRRLNSSLMSTALENRQQGERLEQLDPPSLPQTPVKPKRPLMIAMGAALGLLAGLCLAGWREVRTRAIHTVKDIRAYSRVAVLGDIPLFERAELVRRRVRRGWLAWCAACLAGIAVMACTVAHYYATKL